MNIKTTLAAAAAGALLAVPITAGAVGGTEPTDFETPCGVDAEWMQQHWSDPAHWEDMESFMEEHWDEMGSHMFSGDHGPGMMGGYGRYGGTSDGRPMWQGQDS